VIETLSFPDGTFDVVLSRLMFHHLPHDLKQRGLAELYHVLKTGGRMLIVDSKRPTSVLQRITVKTLIHHGVTSDVHEPVQLMKRVDYTETQVGNTQWSSISFVQGQRATTG
jgi:ubiquinone/menaquinone biosynthesis C-methylase UbiE